MIILYSLLIFKEEITVKQLTSYNRVAGYLNKLFDLLNQRFFESALSRPTITIQSTPRAYGHFSMRDDTWVSVTGSSNEINIGAGTLARPIENICATLLHEMVHYYQSFMEDLSFDVTTCVNVALSSGEVILNDKRNQRIIAERIMEELRKQIGSKMTFSI